MTTDPTTHDPHETGFGMPGSCPPQHGAGAERLWLRSGRANRGWHVRRHRRRFMFLRLWVAFGFVTLVLVAGLAALGYALSQLLRPDRAVDFAPWLVAAGAAVLFPILAAVVARRAFRSIAAPLADIIAAADRVADGDLSVRVTDSGRGDLARLAHSFNRMVEQLQRAEEQRRNLTADVAHELRTPLQIIQGNLEGMVDDVYEPTEENLLSTLEETRSLGRLVDDLRTLSVAEAGQLRLTLEIIPVAELLADLRTSFSGQAEVAGVELRVHSGTPGTKLTVEGDPVRLSQVLSNLIANALRFTPRDGVITLGAEPTATGVRVTVSDSGQGIPAEDLPHVFDRFWRGDRSRGTDGAGLGLAIARQLVQAHGGQITVRSQPGQGTTFTIELPRTQR